ncbi:GTPase [Clostridium butyricum]
MYNTPKSNRLHISIFGKRNAGKSSLINALTNQSLSVVSEIPGTTTDPVSKSMELLPLGPIVLIDTAGLDDNGLLGELRIEKTLKVIEKTDLGVLVFDACSNDLKNELTWYADLEKRKYLR